VQITSDSGKIEVGVTAGPDHDPRQARQQRGALALTRDMNRHTRFVCKPNRGHGNVTGVDNVVSWRTGYPFGVNLGRGYPRFNPGEYTASDVLARGEADAAMIIASDPMANFSQPAREHLASIPFIASARRCGLSRSPRSRSPRFSVSSGKLESTL
jgi:formylmethanofuran dehydrogenase subunit B